MTKKLYGVAEIAAALGVARTNISTWVSRGQMPPPDERLASGPVWYAATIEGWIAKRIASSEANTG